MVQLPIKDWCHGAEFCQPAIKGDVQDSQGNPVPRYLVTIKLDSPVFGVQFCAVGDESKMLQPGQFKFESPDGRTFGEYKLTVVANDRSTPLSQPYTLGMAPLKGNHHDIIFRHK
jgi:hypothetical protein